ncbi:DUF6447 family protein [Devosia sp. SD17-2]|uniref:DUF6447 family protein n=1 Tax=Devosia sp. SD17-2 TaxID=2976459 RepID=UPI0023D7B891|nr:DUF6447 family protein [Devosia sp. SD17-2]WEJ33849.1 DUF6447 family protein [Devosia sp. SD17-2]
MTNSTITIDGTAYQLDALSEGARGAIASIRLVDRKMADLQNELAILRTARQAYARAIKADLKNEG